MSHKVMIVTEAMMPFTTNWGACQRVYHYSKKMEENGYDVTIVCRNTSNIPDGRIKVDGIKVWGTGGHKVNAQTASSNGSISPLREKLKAIDRNVKIASVIARSAYRFLYSEPNLFYGRISLNWTKSIETAVINHINKQNIDIVILSGPTFGPFHLAEAIKATGVKLVLDYRDPWTSWYEKPTLAYAYEKKAIKKADLVITTTDTLTQELGERYKTSKIHTIMNGYDESQWNKVKAVPHDSKQLIISYIGNIKIISQPGFRDATCFLNTAKDFLRKHDDVRIRFIGVQDDINKIDPDLKKCIEFRNTVPVEEALQLTEESDVLLMFHTSSDASGKYIICGKAFDCIRSGNYMLSIGDKAYSNKKIVEDTNSGIHCNNNREDIMNALEHIYKLWKQGDLKGSTVDPKTFSRDFQNKKFVDLLNELA